MYTHIHVHTHTCTHTRHTYILTHLHTHRHINTHTNIYTHIHTYIHTYIDTPTHTHVHPQLNWSACSDIRTYIRMCTWSTKNSSCYRICAHACSVHMPQTAGLVALEQQVHQTVLSANSLPTEPRVECVHGWWHTKRSILRASNCWQTTPC